MRLVHHLKILLFVFLIPVQVLGQIINSYAGNGTIGYSGDGGPSLLATMSGPRGIAIDNFGNLFIADHNNSRIRKVDTSGIISTIAGTGAIAYSGDGGIATLAQLNRPSGVAVDAIGNIFISDSYNHRIRKVDTSGIITTIAGNGNPGFSGDGGPATSALIEWPYAITTDALGNVYFGDSFNARIRKINTSGIISTIAGNGLSGYSGDGGPAILASIYLVTGIMVDSLNNIFFCDMQNHRVRKIDPSGIITTIAGTGIEGFSGDGGSATLAMLAYPHGVFTDSSGDVYITDRNNFRLRKIRAGKIYTIAGNGSYGYSGDGANPLSAQISYPNGIAISSSGKIFLADESYSVIRIICQADKCPINTDSLSKDSNISGVFPNPSMDVITIKGSDDDDLIFSDELGNVIYHITLNNGNNFTISLSNLKNGNYFLIGKNTKKKIVVIH